MRALLLVARRFRNLTDLELELPPTGAAFLGPNGHGKTSVLEALYYPVLFRSFHAATDTAVCQWEAPSFQVVLEAEGGRHRRFEAGFARAGRRKRMVLDGAPVPRVTDALGSWLAVAFLPTDLGLVQGAAPERRRYLDRLLALAEPGYLRALLRYRRTLAQRNAALRAGGPAALADAFTGPLAEAGARVTRARLAWVDAAAERFREACDGLGEAEPVTLRYHGDVQLADPAAWPEALAAARAREVAMGMTLVGPQRDDLLFERNGRALREYGSTGEQRTAAVALKLCEWETLAAARGCAPAMLLDDVFAELDRERQDRLAARLMRPGGPQVFVTAPRRDELPEVLDLDILEVADGAVRPARVTA